MLNKKQIAVLEPILNNQIKGIENVPREIQLIALKAMLSLKYYFEVFDQLKANDIHDVVRAFGEMLSHPFPQNPTENVSISLNRSSSIDPLHVISIKVGKAFMVRKGLFNLTIHNEPDTEVTQAEVSEYIQKYIQNKIDSIQSKTKLRVSDLKSKKRKQLASFTPTRAKKQKFEINEENFLEQTIANQLTYLEATEDHFKACIESNLRIYQMFLKQFERECKTIHEVNVVLKILEELRKECSIYNNKYSLSIHDEINLGIYLEAMKGKFIEYASTNNPNFMTYKLLQRIAMSYGHTNLMSKIDSDFDEIMQWLIKGEQVRELDCILFNHGEKIPFYTINYLFTLACIGSVNAQIIEDLLEVTVPHNTVPDTKTIITGIEKMLSSENDNTKALLVILRCTQFQERLSIELSKKITAIAIKSNNDEFQVLAMLHTPDANKVRGFFISSNTFELLILNKYYLAAEKMAHTEFGSTLTSNDLLKAQILSNGKFSARHVGNDHIETTVSDDALNTVPQLQAASNSSSSSLPASASSVSSSTSSSASSSNSSDPRPITHALQLASSSAALSSSSSSTRPRRARS